MSAVIDPKKYAKLLATQLPKVISSDDEHARLMSEVENMMKMGPKLGVEERELMQLLVTLIADYEAKHFADKLPKVSPVEMLEHLMESHEHTAKDLWPVIADKGTVSKILNGDRAISKRQAKRLGEFYKVSPSLFI